MRSTAQVVWARVLGVGEGTQPQRVEKSMLLAREGMQGRVHEGEGAVSSLKVMICMLELSTLTCHMRQHTLRRRREEAPSQSATRRENGGCR